MKTKTRTRLLSLLVTLAMILTSFAVVIPASAADVWDGSAAESFNDGEGTAENPYVIKTAAELKYFADQVNGGDTFEGKYVVLADDIDLNKIDWAPMAQFNGTFDGQGHTISNAKLVTPQAMTYAGFFARTLNATVVNLTLELVDANLNGKTNGNSNAEACIGGLIGFAVGNITVTNVAVTGNMYIAVAGWGGQGAMIGALHNSGAAANMVITDCYTDVDLVVDVPGTNTTRVGGLVGSFLGNNNESYIAFVRCDTDTSVEFCTGTGNTRVGAMMGCMQNPPAGTTVLGCIASGFRIKGNVFAMNNGGAGYGWIGYNQAASKLNTFANYGETFSGWAFSSATNMSDANTGTLGIGANTEDGKTTVTILKATVDFLNKKYTVADDAATTDVNEYACNWSVDYNGASIKGDAGVANEAGDLSFTFDAVEGKSATVVMGGLNYNLRGDEEISDLITDRAFAGGTGTEADPYQISTPAQLFHLGRTVIAGTTYADQYIVLTNDIDMADYPWTMHHDNGAAFSGTLDGQGYTIDNFNIVGVAGNNAGLFTKTLGATFKNLTIISPDSSVYVKATPQVSILVGQAGWAATTTKPTSFINVTAKGSVHILCGHDKNGNNAGAFVAEARSEFNDGRASVYFENCVADYTITGHLAASTTRFGGFIGMLNCGSGGSGYGDLYMINCYGKLDVNVRSGNNHRYGGLVGVYQVNVVNTYLVACEGTITRAGDFKGSAGAGPFIGCINNSTNFYVIDCPDLPTIGNFIALSSEKCKNFSISYYNIAVTENDGTTSVFVPYETTKKLGEYSISYGTAAGTKTTDKTGDTWTFTTAENTYPVVTTAKFNYRIDGYHKEYEHWLAHAADAFASGSGTANDPYIIETTAQLAFFSREVGMGKNFAGLNVMLADDANIVVDSYSWVPIGNAGCGFAGYFDGNSYGGASITMVYDNSFVVTGTWGLFGVIAGGTVDCLDLYLQYNDVKQPTGAIAGLTNEMKGGEIINTTIIVDGTIQNTSGSMGYFGGVAYRIASGEHYFENVVVEGNLKFLNDQQIHVSPMVAEFQGGTIEVYNSRTSLYLDYTCLTTVNSVTRFGALVARQSGTGTKLIGENIVFNGGVTIGGVAAAPRVGGMVGDVQGGTVEITNCFAAIDLDFTQNARATSYYAGSAIGRFGSIEEGTVVTNCYGNLGEPVGVVEKHPDHDTPVEIIRQNYTVEGSFVLGVAMDGGKVYVSAEAWEALQEIGADDIAVVYDEVEESYEPDEIDEYNNVAIFEFDEVEGATAYLRVTFYEMFEDLYGDPADFVATFNAVEDADWTLFAASSYASGTGTAYVPAVPEIPAQPAVGVEGEEGYVPGTEAIPGIPAKEADPYVIETPAQMARLMYTTKFFTYETYGLSVRPHNATYVLAADLDMGLFQWSPIANRHSADLSNGFEFDGAGYTISNVNLTADAYVYSQAMFGRLGSAVIKNFNVDGIYLGNADLGYSVPAKAAIVGANYGGTIDNVHVTNLFIEQTDAFAIAYVGGIAGYLTEKAVVSNCSVSGAIVYDIPVGSEFTMIGGVAARMANTATITNVNADVNILVTSDINTDVEAGKNRGFAVGGVVGQISPDSDSQIVLIENVTVTGDVALIYTGEIATYIGVGGVVGVLSDGTVTIKNTVVLGEVLVEKSETAEGVYVGGVIGRNNKAQTTLEGVLALNTEVLIGHNMVVGEAPVEPTISASVAGILGLDILEGARVRIAPDAIENSGLRFDGYVNEDVFTAITDAGFIAWVGTAITTEDRLDAVDGDWAALEDDVDKLTVDAGDFVNGPDYNFTGAIINIKEDNYDVNFVATTYITIILVEGQEATEDTEAVEEVSITIYAENETVRSIEYVATQALADAEANYTEAQKAILNAYVGA